MSEGFYSYYFLDTPEKHPYPVERVFDSDTYRPSEGVREIKSLQQFQWGIRRFVMDAMLYWGNLRQAYRELRVLTRDQIADRFASKRMDESHMATRGSVIQPHHIPQDHRYLITEMACKTYEDKKTAESAAHVQLALQAFRELKGQRTRVTPELLKSRTKELADRNNQRQLFELLFEDCSEELLTEEAVLALYSGQYESFKSAREKALQNTRNYLSICNDLDVYVATSMRTRQDFREMASACDAIFTDRMLEKYNIRYFDPTLSAAEHHEDKGIIECLMVKTAKVVLYFAQYKESLGKVSEYAMALSLGKPVIILCPSDGELYRFYLDQHPLLRLIEFRTGIVNGAIVTCQKEQVVQLLVRIFSNQMEYDIIRKAGSDAYYLLKERLTGTTVRVLTDNDMLTETFWNYYHQTP